MICGTGFLGGIPVGIIANQPSMMGGVLDSNASRKGARFIIRLPLTDPSAE